MLFILSHRENNDVVLAAVGGIETLLQTSFFIVRQMRIQTGLIEQLGWRYATALHYFLQTLPI